MALSMYQASVPVFRRALTNLSAILDKGAASAAQRKIDFSVLLNMRLAPDMFPLVRQVQGASDNAKGAAARLAAIDPPKFPDTETTHEELKARVARTLDFLASLQPAQIDGSEQREITLLLGTGPITFTGQDYLLNFALPNFFFHVTTAYDILRHAGVEIGKRDFLGPR
jgi:hypothetical protein